MDIEVIKRSIEIERKMDTDAIEDKKEKMDTEAIKKKHWDIKKDGYWCHQRKKENVGR